MLCNMFVSMHIVLPCRQLPRSVQSWSDVYVYSELFISTFFTTVNGTSVVAQKSDNLHKKGVKFFRVEELRMLLHLRFNSCLKWT